MSDTAPPSPGAPSDNDEPPDADDLAAGAEGDAPKDGGPVGAPADEEQKLLTFYAKNYYAINPDHLRFCQNQPYKMDNGLAMYQLHDSKSFKAWDEEYIVRPRNIIKIIAGGQCGWYVCFAKDGVDSNDRFVARAIHKQIAKRFFDQWNKEWTPARKEKYAELLRDEPSDLKQINPLVVGWEQVEAPSNILYERPKTVKKDKSDGPSQAGKGSGKNPNLDVLEDDDGQSSAAASAPPATPNDTALVGYKRARDDFPGPASGPQFFLQTPGMPPLSCFHSLSFLSVPRPWLPRNGDRERGLAAEAHCQPAHLKR